MRTALGFHPQQVPHILKGMIAPLPIPEDSITIARSQGWIILAADSAISADDLNVNVQSNPRRIADTGDDVA